MADIFLSYAREDREKAERLAKALEGQGWSVFWDLTIPAGESWDSYIEGELEKARCVVVAWSEAAVGSKWVGEEAREGRDREILVPVFFADVKPPFGFRGIQGPDLSGWEAGTEAAAFQTLVQGIERHIGPAVKKRRPPPIKRGAPGAAGAPTWEEDEKLNRRIRIKGGEFLMGSPEGVGFGNERPQHRVRLSSFCLQEHPVTNEEYRRFSPDHEFAQGKEKHPVVNVRWDNASNYAEWLGGRLPTEAEWEYACRAGTETRYWCGDSEEDLARVGWYDDNSGGDTHRVGEKPANPWGLYDMHGNVLEWVVDCYGPYAEGPQDDPLNPDSSSGRRVVRGGSFRDEADFACSADRSWLEPDDRFSHLGFRVAFDAAPSKEE